MKKMQYVAMLCLPLLGQAQTSEVQIAGSNYPVIFADTNLSSVVRQHIASDLTIVFSLAPSFEEAMGGDEVKATVDLPGGGTSIANLHWEGVFRPSERYSMFDDEKRDGFFLVNYDNQKSIRVNKLASDRYLQAFTWMKANSNAVQKAYKFVALMNNTNLVSQPTQVLRNLSHIVPTVTLSDDEIRTGFALMQKDKYLGISALSFFVEQRSEADDAEVPVFHLFAVKKTNPFENIAMAYPILYHKGRWGFGKIW